MKNVYGRLNFECGCPFHCYAVFLSIPLDYVTVSSLAGLREKYE
jgi:hypothetical protein